MIRWNYSFGPRTRPRTNPDCCKICKLRACCTAAKLGVSEVELAGPDLLQMCDVGAGRTAELPKWLTNRLRWSSSQIRHRGHVGESHDAGDRDRVRLAVGLSSGRAAHMVWTEGCWAWAAAHLSGLRGVQFAAGGVRATQYEAEVVLLGRGRGGGPLS